MSTHHFRPAGYLHINGDKYPIDTILAGESKKGIAVTVSTYIHHGQEADRVFVDTIVHRAPKTNWFVEFAIEDKGELFAMTGYVAHHEIGIEDTVGGHQSITFTSVRFVGKSVISPERA